MTSEWEMDFSDQIVQGATAADSTLTVPEALANKGITDPNNTGSWWFLSVDGNPVSIGPTDQTFATNAVVEPGSYFSHPFYYQPGSVLHLICASSKTATVSLIRGRRAS